MRDLKSDFRVSATHEDGSKFEATFHAYVPEAAITGHLATIAQSRGLKYVENIIEIRVNKIRLRDPRRDGQAL